MILTDEEVEARLTSPENLINKVQIVRIPIGGRKVGDVAVPPMVRGLIASLSLESKESDKEIGNIFGVSQPTVSNSARGLVGDRKEDSLDEVIDTTKQTLKQKSEDAHNLALDALMASLTAVGPKIVQAAPGMQIIELTRTAKDLGNVVANIQRNKLLDKDATENKTIVILHTTERRNESKYDVIDV